MQTVPCKTAHIHFSTSYTYTKLVLLKRKLIKRYLTCMSFLKRVIISSSDPLSRVGLCGDHAH